MSGAYPAKISQMRNIEGLLRKFKQPFPMSILSGNSDMKGALHNNLPQTGRAIVL
jgi:hypothetical protein